MTGEHKGDPYGEQRLLIDRIDAEILDLLNRRARAAVEIGRIKRERGQPIFAPEREQAVLERLAHANRGPLSGEAVRAVFRTIIEQVRALEQHHARD